MIAQVMDSALYLWFYVMLWGLSQDLLVCLSGLNNINHKRIKRRGTF